MTLTILLIILLAIMNRMPIEKREAIILKAKTAVLKAAQKAAPNEDIAKPAMLRAKKTHHMITKAAKMAKRTLITAESILKQTRRKAKAAIRTARDIRGTTLTAGLHLIKRTITAA